MKVFPIELIKAFYQPGIRLTGALLCALMTINFAHGADAVPGEELCDRVVDKLVFEGNESTRDSVIRRELPPMQGLPCSLDNIVDGTQAIMDLRLFKQVRPELILGEDELVLRYTVVEKIHFLPLPRFSRTSDGELRWGLQLRWDNFRGMHHRVRLTAEQRKHESESDKDGEMFRFLYQVPRFMGTKFGMSMNLSRASQQATLSRDEQFFGDSEVQTNLAALSFSRWYNVRSAARGVTASAGVVWQSKRHNLYNGIIGSFEEGEDIQLTLGFRNSQERDELYRLRGFSYGVDFSLSSPVIGSDYKYHKADLYFVRYMPVDHGGIQNLNYRLRLAYSNGGPFGERLFALGGGDIHRGLKPGARDGDVLTLFNIEYLSAVAAYPALRWTVFSDIGNVYTYDNIDMSHQVVGIGTGLRWKILSLANTDLRVDLAWSPELDKPRFYFATNLTF